MNYRKLRNSILIFSLAVALSGCSNTANQKRIKIKASPALYKSSSDFYENTLETNIQGVLERSIEASEFILSEDLDNDPYQTIYNSITFTVLDETIQYKDGYAYVDVNFSMADYEPVIEDPNNLTDSLTFAGALSKADRITIPATYQVERQDEQWVVINTDEVKSMLTPFDGLEINYAPVAKPIELSHLNYACTVSYKDNFDSTMSSVLGQNLELQGELNLYLTLSFDEDKAYVALDENQLREDIKNYALNNREAIVYASSGVSISTAKVFTGMTDEEIDNTIMDSINAEVNTIDFSQFSMTGAYEIDGENIIIYGEDNKGIITGNIDGTSIVLDISNNTNIDSYFQENILTFSLC